jgi:hypothetical protein
VPGADKYRGTRIWLKLEGMHDPPEEFVRTFHHVMVRRALIGLSISLLLAALWFLLTYAIQKS